MPNESLLAYLTRTVGIWRAAKVGGFIVAWGIYSESLADGESPTLAGCGRYWRRSDASMFRDQREFRKAFPDHETPERLWQTSKALGRKRLDLHSQEEATAELLVMKNDWGMA